MASGSERVRKLFSAVVITDECSGKIVGHRSNVDGDLCEMERTERHCKSTRMSGNIEWRMLIYGTEMQTLGENGRGRNGNVNFAVLEQNVFFLWLRRGQMDTWSRIRTTFTLRDICGHFDSSSKDG